MEQAGQKTETKCKCHPLIIELRRRLWINKAHPIPSACIDLKDTRVWLFKVQGNQWIIDQLATIGGPAVFGFCGSKKEFEYRLPEIQSYDAPIVIESKPEFQKQKMDGDFDNSLPLHYVVRELAKTIETLRQSNNQYEIRIAALEARIDHLI